MRLTSLFVFVTAVLATSVVAYETNAQRFARGLPPNPPVRRGVSNTDSAEHHHPSGKPPHHHHGGGDDDDDKDGKGDHGHDTKKHVARGLSPSPIARRDASDTDSAAHHHPSSKPPPHHGGGGDDDHNKCKTGAIKCCNSVSNSANPVVKTIAGLVKAKLPDNTPIGLGCSDIGEHSCSAHTCCCENNSYSGLIAIGCVSVKISV